MVSQSQFDKAMKAVNEHSQIIEKCPLEDKREIYAWFKQASDGDVSTPEPQPENEEDYIRWHLWKSKAGTPKNVAMERFFKLAERCLPNVKFA